jgi:ArsR family transcriptional regulator
MLGALAASPRLRIVRLLLAAHPEGLVVGDIQSELDIPGSTLSHHLEKLKSEDLISVRRNARFLWYTANTKALDDLLHFLTDECCSRSKGARPKAKLKLCQRPDA